MKIGVCVYHKKETDIDKSLAAIVQYGFSECQLISWDPTLWTDEEAEKIRLALNKHHVTVSAFWCGWEGPRVWDFYDGQETLGLVPPALRARRVQNLCDGADFAKKLGIVDIATHMGFIPENPYDMQYRGFVVAVRTVAQHLKKNGQYLLFESGQETPVAMLRTFEDVGCDNLGVNFDTGNVILYGKANPVDALDMIGKYIRNVHAKDGEYPTNGHKLGREVPLGSGKANFPVFLRKLHDLGYNGAITIEREISGEQQITDILNAKQLIEDVIKDF